MKLFRSSHWGLLLTAAAMLGGCTRPLQTQSLSLAVRGTARTITLSGQNPACFLVNVMGSGIGNWSTQFEKLQVSPNASFDLTKVVPITDKTPGAVVTQQVVLDVPAGNERIVQIIGAYGSATGCNSASPDYSDRTAFEKLNEIVRVKVNMSSPTVTIDLRDVGSVNPTDVRDWMNPAPPGAFAISSATAGDGQVVLSWGDSSNATSYTVKYGTSSGSYPTTFSTSATSPTTITGLTNGTTYYFMVTAVNAGGSTNATSEASASPVPPPGAFTISSATAGNGQVVLSWGASSNATSYTVKYGTSSGSYPTTFSTSATSPTTVTGLADYTTYYFMVTAVNGGGSTNAGAEASATPAAAWAQQAYIKAANANTFALFGSSVAIDGNTAVVGASGESSNQTTITNGTSASSDTSAAMAGAAYVYLRSGTNWAQQAYLKAPNTDAGDGLGSAVAISGDTIVVGAPGESSNQTTITNGTSASSDNSDSAAGAVYVFQRSGTNWAQQAYIKPPNPDANDGFGQTLAISGDTIAVGSAGESSNQTTITNGTSASSDNSDAQSGAVYVFQRTGTNWAQQAYIKAPNTAAGSKLGFSVAVSGDTIVAGAVGESSGQTTITNGATASSDTSLPNSGAAYVFQRTGTIWAQQAYIKAPNAKSNVQFGRAVAISGDTVVVGVPAEASNQNTITNGTSASSNTSDPNSGAAYVFFRTGTTWAEQAYIKAPNVAIGNAFGVTVAIDGNRIVVGSPNESSNQTTVTNGTSASSNTSSASSGAVYIFSRSGANWSQEAYVKPPNTGPANNFGESVAVSGSTTLAGSTGESSNQTTITNGGTASSDTSVSGSGAAYVFVTP